MRRELASQAEGLLHEAMGFVERLRSKCEAESRFAGAERYDSLKWEMDFCDNFLRDAHAVINALKKETL